MDDFKKLKEFGLDLKVGPIIYGKAGLLKLSKGPELSIFAFIVAK